MISCDTNVFVYASDPRDPAKRAAADAIVSGMGQAHGIVGLQVIGELQNALRRKLCLPPWDAYQAAHNLLMSFPTFGYDRNAVEIALGEAIVGRLGYWDGLLLAAADAVGVRTMISEDMADGLIFRGLEVVNPFGSDGAPSDRVRQLLKL
jgi:predicted nucleic acid-binding protein